MLFTLLTDALELSHINHSTLEELGSGLSEYYLPTMLERLYPLIRRLVTPICESQGGQRRPNRYQSTPAVGGIHVDQTSNGTNRQKNPWGRAMVTPPHSIEFPSLFLGWVLGPVIQSCYHSPVCKIVNISIQFDALR